MVSGRSQALIAISLKEAGYDPRTTSIIDVGDVDSNVDCDVDNRLDVGDVDMKRPASAAISESKLLIIPFNCYREVSKKTSVAESK